MKNLWGLFVHLWNEWEKSPWSSQSGSRSFWGLEITKIFSVPVPKSAQKHPQHFAWPNAVCPSVAFPGKADQSRDYRRARNPYGGSLLRAS